MPATLSKPAQPPAPPVAKTEPKPPPLPGATLPRAETAQSERKAPRAATAPPIAAPSLPPAAQSLASQAEQQRQSGDYAGAAASLERSLRINAPLEGKAYLLNRLARVRMEQGQASQAASFAARSNDLVGDNAIVKKDNWRIIAESRRRAGETDAAAEAERRAGAD
jgi:Tfp pilus assembly protein PilF